MNAAADLPLVAVDALRIGMFVQLELGWMAHPFPRGSFRIASDEQIETMRRLGLQQVRWCPKRSVGPSAAGHTEPVAAPTATEPAPTAASAAAPRRRASATAAEPASLRRCERRFAEAARALRRATEQVATQPLQAAAQVRQLSRALVDDLQAARDVTIRLLNQASGERAATHALNVTVIALLMGRNFGLDDAEMMDLGVGGLLHDVGKLDLPPRLRSRDDDWSAAELEQWRGHVALGVAHGRRMQLADGALRVIAEHHEQADGHGFPARLNIDRMSAAARIVALVDRFDNLCNPPLAARALTPHESLSLMFAQGQRQFDTTMLSAFIRMMGVYPPGSAVQLTDERYALVVSVNSTRPLKPCVLLHDPLCADQAPRSLDLETVPGLGIRRSLKPSQLPPAALRQLAPQPRPCYGFDAPQTADPAAPA